MFPERQTVDLLIQHLEGSCFLYNIEEFFNVLYNYSDVVDGSIFHFSLMGLVGLNDEVVEQEKGYFLIAVYCAEGSFEAQGMIKLSVFF